MSLHKIFPSETFKEISVTVGNDALLSALFGQIDHRLSQESSTADSLWDRIELSNH